MTRSLVPKSTMRIVDFSMPDTFAARGALTFATEYQSTAITAHAMRSWLWAEAFAMVGGLTDVDHELLFVAALLHDIGTVTEFDNHSISYEHSGGHVAVALTAGSGWTAERRRRVLDVIVRHNWPSVDPELDVEGHLLEIATGQQAERKPTTAARRLVDGGIVRKLAENPLERL